MMKTNRIKIAVAGLFIVLGILLLPSFDTSSQVSAATTTIKYKYQGKNKTYKGKKRSVVYEGKTVSLSKTPLFVMDKYNMVPYYEVFVKNTIKAKKTYSSKTKTLVLEGNGHVVQLKVNSKTAYVDGKKVTLGAAPRIITYRDSNLKRIMVPIKPVAKAFGLTYSYSSETGVVTLTNGTEENTTTDTTTDTTVGTAQESSELRAMWISYLEFDAYLSTYTPNEANFTTFITRLYDSCVNNNMNAVIVHVRPFGDALYNSSYFPWSEYISGKQGKDPGFDPLSIMIEEAHKRNLEFHAWLNPYRVAFHTSYSKLSADNPARIWHNNADTKRNVLSYGGKLYYNPAQPEVRELIINGIKEIVEGYDVDGIHLDDYFYPSFTTSNVKTAFDAKEYKAYKNAQIAAGESYLSIYNWRRDNVNQLVSGIYEAVKETKEDVVFGISPAGNIDNLKSNTSYYVDIDTWLNNEGYVDYIMPQIYWGFTHKTAAYDDVLDRWVALNKKGIVDLYVGIGVYKVGMAKSSSYSDWKEWQQDTNLLKKQVTYARKTGKVKGFAFFSYEYFDTKGTIKFSTKSFSTTRKNYLTKSIKKLKSVLN